MSQTFAVNVIIVNPENSALICRLGPASPDAGKWSLPSLQADGDENLKDCAVRACRVLGLSLEPSGLKMTGVHAIPPGAPDQVVTTSFSASLPEGQTPSCNGRDFDELSWVSSVSGIPFASSEQKLTLAGFLFKRHEESDAAKREELLLQALHHASFRNEEWVRRSALCGCFYCRKTFPPSEITSWCDDNDQGPRTALCPCCGIDSVLSEITPVGRITNMPPVLKNLHDRFF